MAVANPYLMEDLYDFTTVNANIVDLDTGVELFSASLKSHSINKTVTKTPLKAGVGGMTWVELEENDDFTVEIQDLQSKVDMEALKLSGSLPVEKSIELTALPKNYTLTSGGSNKLTITLDQEPIAGQTVTVYRTDNGKPIVSSRVSFSTKTLTIDTSASEETVDGLAAGNVVMVGSYKYNQDNAKVIDIKAEAVGKNVSLTLEQPIYDANKKVKYYKQYHFFRCSLGSEFTSESSTEMSEQPVSSSFTVLKDPTRDTLGFIAYIPVGSNGKVLNRSALVEARKASK